MFAEITLGFIVACALSLPELIRAKAPDGLRRCLSDHFRLSQISERDALESPQCESTTGLVFSRRDGVGGAVTVPKQERLVVVEARTNDSAV
jgi:hypothetical protein